MRPLMPVLLSTKVLGGVGIISQEVRASRINCRHIKCKLPAHQRRQRPSSLPGGLVEVLVVERIRDCLQEEDVGGEVEMEETHRSVSLTISAARPRRFASRL